MHRVAQPVVERADAGSAQLALRRLLEQGVVRDLAEVPALTVEVDRLSVHAVLLQGERVEGVPHGQQVGLGVVAHQVEPEPVHPVLLRPEHDGVDHELLGQFVLGGDVLAAGGGLDGSLRVETVVVTGHDLVEHRFLPLAALRGVVEHLVEHDLQAVLVQGPYHGAELGHPGAAIGVHRIGPFRRREVERVVPPVETVLVPDRLDARLLVRRGRSEGGQVAGRHGLEGAVFLDRGDVEGRQQVHGVEPGSRQLGQMPGSRAVDPERAVGAAELFRHGVVGDREVAHVQFVDRPVHGLLDDRRLRFLPRRGAESLIGQVDEHRPGGVLRQGDRVRVGDLVHLDLPRRRREHRDLEDEGCAGPVLGAGRGPRAVILARQRDALRVGRVARRPDERVDVLRRGSPNRDRGPLLRPGDAERPVCGGIREEVVEHAGQLHARERSQAAEGVVGAGIGAGAGLGHRQLGSEQPFHLCPVHTDRAQGHGPGQGRETRFLRVGEAGRVVLEGDRVSAGHRSVDDRQAGGRRGVQRVTEPARVCVHGQQVTRPGECFFTHPVRALRPGSGQRRVGHRDRENVGGQVVGEQGLLALGGRERQVRAVGHAVGAVVLVPAEVVRDLRLVRAGRQGVRTQGEDAVAVHVLQPGCQAVRFPVSGASGLLLEGTGRDDDVALGGALEEVVARVEVERDRAAVGRVAHVGAAGNPAGTVVEVPGAVDGDLVLVVAGRKVEGAGVDAVGPEGQFRGLTAGLPVPGTTHLGIVTAGHRDQVDRGVGRAGVGERHRVAHGGEAGRGGPLAGGIRGDGAVLDQGPRGKSCRVVEDARAGVLGGAETGPGGVTHDPPGEAGLLPGPVVDGGPHR